MTSKTYVVPNISCSHCTHTIERELELVEGVESVHALRQHDDRGGNGHQRGAEDGAEGVGRSGNRVMASPYSIRSYYKSNDK